MKRTITSKCIYLLTATMLSVAAPGAIAGYNISNYMEGDFDYHKWYGKEDATYLRRRFTPHSSTYEGYLNANWDMYEYTGEDGGPDGEGGWTTQPNKLLYTWHMRTEWDGTIKEVGDTYWNAPCTLVFESGKEILWGTGNMTFNQLYENQLHYTGGCGENWGWNDVRIINTHDTYTIPAVTSNHGWSCPAATFQDVIVIMHTQWYCSNEDCTEQSEDRQRYWLAKDFGPIKLWGDNGYIIRRLWDEDGEYLCAADWIQQN